MYLIMNLDEKMISSQMLHKGKILNLRVDFVELPDGNVASREVIEHSGAVAVVPITDNDEIIMVKQYRHPMQEILLEIPAGRLKQNEDKDDCAKRELLEETGMIARNIKRVFSFFSSPGFCNEIVHLYVATELTYKEQQLDKGEFLEVVKVPIKKAVEMIYRGEIKDAKTIAGILNVALKIQMHLTCDENF